MCGLAGWVQRTDQDNSEELLTSMANTIDHRGPDDEGYSYFVSKDQEWHIGLAHKRLAILDLEGGHQPMSGSTGDLTIIFNGEIYNFSELTSELQSLGHTFTSRSDTEVILKAYKQWGEKCVSRLEGMFALVIWDSVEQTLFLARDRYGKKPLYLSQVGGGIVFGSEIKALLAHPRVTRQVDNQTLGAYLMYRYVPGPRTLHKDVYKLRPGHFAIWRKGQLYERRYFGHPDSKKASHTLNPSNREVIPQFLNCLDKAVQSRMVCDVPFGAFLSGGLDSSTVVALMTNHSQLPVRTFSVGFSNNAYSELGYAAQIAKVFGTQHHELVVNENQLMDHLPRLINFRDAPVSEPSDIPIYLLSLEARKHVKMVLTGEGSDEVLGGYPKHVFEPWSKYYRKIPASIRDHFVTPFVHNLPYKFSRIKTAIDSMGIVSFPERMARWFGSLSIEEVENLLLDANDSMKYLNQIGNNTHRDQLSNTDLRNILFFDQTIWLPDNLLERGDRMTMAASLEARMPFMDHQLAALVSSLPDKFRVRGTATKWILRQAAQSLIPKRILDRPKVGFKVPVNEWFKGKMRDYIQDTLLSEQTLTRNILDRKRVQRIFDEHTSGEVNNEKLLWSLINLELWYQQYGN